MCMPQKIFTATTDFEIWKGWHQWDWDELEVRSSDLTGHLWKCKQLEIEEMAVCLSVGPGGSWIKAFQQIVSIISLLLLPLPTFFTIPAPAPVFAPGQFTFGGFSHGGPFPPVWEISSSCSWIWNGLLMWLMWHVVFKMSETNKEF